MINEMATTITNKTSGLWTSYWRIYETIAPRILKIGLSLRGMTQDEVAEFTALTQHLPTLGKWPHFTSVMWHRYAWYLSFVEDKWGGQWALDEPEQRIDIKALRLGLYLWGRYWVPRIGQGFSNYQRLRPLRWSWAVATQSTNLTCPRRPFWPPRWAVIH